MINTARMTCRIRKYQDGDRNWLFRGSDKQFRWIYHTGRLSSPYERSHQDIRGDMVINQ
jgi:hypothetical protein